MIKFGTDGWRGVIADDFTFENVRIVAFATVKWLFSKNKNPEIVIGYDRRFLSTEFAKTAAEVFAAYNVKVFFSPDYAPTPAVSLGVTSTKATAGIVITASHNPYFFNGYKIKEWFGGPADELTTGEIEKNVSKYIENPEKIEHQKFEDAKNSGKIEIEDIKSPYVESIKKYIDRRVSKRKAIFDAMWGASANLSKFIFNSEEIRSEPDPTFGAYLDGNMGRPEPTPLTLTPLFKKCSNLSLDGFAVDGDGDRIAASTKNGEFIDAHKILALLAEHLYKNRKIEGKVYKNFPTSDIVDKISQYYGIELITTPVGFKHIAKGMKEDKVIVGGEESGGIGVPSHLLERDGLFCAALLMEMSEYEGKSLGKLVESLEKRFGPHKYVRRDVHEKDPEKKSEYLRVAEKIDKLNNLVIETKERIDGVKLRFKKGGFLMIRPSGTEPLVRIYCEMGSFKKANKTIDSFVKLINR